MQLTTHVSNKECDADPNGCEISGFMLNNRKHGDGEDELCRSKHLDEKTSRD